MARNIWLLLLAANLGIVGCQNAKMSTAPKKQVANNGYYQGQRPLPRQAPPPYHPAPPPQQEHPGVVTLPRVQEDDSETYVENDQTTYGRPNSAEDYVGELNPLAQTGQRPQFEQENEVEYYDFRKIPRLLDTCREGCALPEPPPPKETCREGTECEEKKPIIGSCAPIHLPGKTKAQKLDILFVVDTSKSMRSKKKETKTSELEDMVSQMKSFIKELDADADYNIGVLLGHSPATSKSPHNFFGKLYSKGTGDSEVLSIGKYISEGKAKGLSDSEARKKAEDKIVAALKKKFSNLATDPSAIDRNDAYGEVGLLSLYHAMTDGHALRDLQGDGNREEGLMRDGAALNVIFVSDENDACYDYDAVGIKPRVNDPKEVKTFGSICKNGGPNGQRLTEDDVLQALRKAKGNDKVILSAVIYNNEKTLPALGPNDENDIGHGYKELVEKAHGDQNTEKGPLADLAKRDFGTLMGQIGEFAQEEMNYVYRFECVTNVLATNITTPFDMLVKKNGKTIGHFNTGCGYNTKGGEKIKGVCPEGAFPIKPTTKKEKVEKRDEEKQIVITIEPDTTPEGKSSRAEIKRIQDSLDEDGATVEITFTKKEEDGISNIEQLQYMKSKIPMAKRQSQATREENETDNNDNAAAAPQIAAPKPDTKARTSTPSVAEAAAVTPKPNTTVRSSTTAVAIATGKPDSSQKVDTQQDSYGMSYNGNGKAEKPPGVTTLPQQLKKKPAVNTTKESAKTRSVKEQQNAKTTQPPKKDAAKPTTTKAKTTTQPIRHEPLTPYERMMKNQAEKGGATFPSTTSQATTKGPSTVVRKPNIFQKFFALFTNKSAKPKPAVQPRPNSTSATTIQAPRITNTQQKPKSNLVKELNKLFAKLFSGSKKGATQTRAQADAPKTTAQNTQPTKRKAEAPKKTVAAKPTEPIVKAKKPVKKTKPAQSKAVAPKTEAPKAVAPKTEAPKAVAPKTEAPKAVAPKAEAPKAVAPKAEAPKAAKPPVVVPETADKGGPHGSTTLTPPATETVPPAKKNLLYPPAPTSEDGE